MTGVRPSRFAGRRKLAALYIVGAHQIGWGIATRLDPLVADPSEAVLHELIPPLWRRVMDRRVARMQARL